MKIIMAVLVVGFLTWLAETFGLDNVFGRTLTIRPMTWDGKVSVVQRSNADYR